MASVVTLGFPGKVVTLGFSSAILVATGDPLEATFSQTRSRFGTRVTQRRPNTTTQGRMDLKENDSVETT